MKKIIIAGAGGLIGKPLIERLKNNYEVVRLERGARDRWAAQVEDAYAVVNLSGEPIAGKRWTSAQKKELIQSRLLTTKALVDAMAAASKKPAVFLNASAIGYYGSRDEAPLDEMSASGTGFLPDLCREWERQANKAEVLGIRTVFLRTGIVLSTRGGALAKMLPPFRLGLGGPLGHGRQYMSWIHIEDEVEAIVYALENEAMRGPVNLTAPQAVPMKDFAVALGKTLKRPAFFPVPAVVLKLALGEMSELLLEGQNVKPTRLEAAGFRFKHPHLEGALAALLGA
jgi:uncharacterized protein (TIGR01777 family)